MVMLLDNLECLVWYEYDVFKLFCGVDNEDFDEMIFEICELMFKLGMVFGYDSVCVVELDVFICQVFDGSWQVEFNLEILFCVLVNNCYYNEIYIVVWIENEKSFIIECSQNVFWLVKSLDQCVCIILKVVSEIVCQQDMFLVNGVVYLCLLNLKMVVDVIGMYEFIVSWVMFNKFVFIFCGMFELKYFFIFVILFVGGGEVYFVEVVCYRIKMLIGQEILEDVLFDDKFVNFFYDEGIEIVCWIVVKY